MNLKSLYETATVVHDPRDCATFLVLPCVSMVDAVMQGEQLLVQKSCYVDEIYETHFSFLICASIAAHALFAQGFLSAYVRF